VFTNTVVKHAVTYIHMCDSGGEGDELCTLSPHSDSTV
jgi:hypothetical protein